MSMLFPRSVRMASWMCATALFVVVVAAIIAIAPVTASAAAPREFGDGLSTGGAAECDRPTLWGNNNITVTFSVLMITQTLLGGVSRLSPAMLGAIDHATYVVVPDSQVASGDASYDGARHQVLIPLSLEKAMWNATFAATFNYWAYLDRDARHNLVVGMSLLLHETMHSWQDCTGLLGQEARNIAAAPNDDTKLREYVQQIELPAQQVQETMQRRLGEPPRTGVWLTIDDSGNPLPVDTAVANMIGTHYDALPTADGAVFGASANGAATYPGFKFPGFKFPGFKFPGFKFPGYAS